MYPSFQLDAMSLQLDTDLLHLPMVEFLGAATLAAPFFSLRFGTNGVRIMVPVGIFAFLASKPQNLRR